jgi:hypothetical protein
VDYEFANACGFALISVIRGCDVLNGFPPLIIWTLTGSSR